MDEQMHGRKRTTNNGGRTDENGWTNKCTDGRTKTNGMRERTDEQMGGWDNRWMDGRTQNGQTDRTERMECWLSGQTDEQTNGRTIQNQVRNGEALCEGSYKIAFVTWTMTWWRVLQD